MTSFLIYAWTSLVCFNRGSAGLKLPENQMISSMGMIFLISLIYPFVIGHVGKWLIDHAFGLHMSFNQALFIYGVFELLIPYSINKLQLGKDNQVYALSMEK